MRFCILVYAPPGWQHTGIYTEVAQTLVYGFRRAGHEADVSINSVQPQAINVLINAHMLPESAVGQFPPDLVIYNLEHIEPTTWDWAPSLKLFVQRYEVWDYSRRNVARLAELNPRVLWLPLGSEPEMTRIAKAKPQDIDVLFYGFVNDRRRSVLDAVAAEGLRVEAPFGVYGRPRDELIARAKIVLNVHQLEGRVLEMVRVSYLLANRKAVVTEQSAGLDDEPGLAGAVHSVAYDELAQACRMLVRDDGRRRALELAAFRWMSARRQSQAIKDLLKARDKKR